jgi:PEP-CTERM motif
MRRPAWTVVLAVCWCVLLASRSGAATFTYTFETPNFTSGQTTPLLNVAPNIGGGTFLTSFTDASDPDGYEIAPFQPNPLVTGLSLVAPTTTTPLSLTFNTVVTQLSVNFGMNGPQGPFGFLRLITPSGSVDQAGSNVGGVFPGGTLTFSSASPFTTATLQAFLSGGALATQLDIDNLILTTPTAVPEPATLTLVGLGVSALAVRRKRRA